MSVFWFPKEPKLRAKWTCLIPRQNLFVHDKTLSCEEHFTEQFIIRFDSVTRTDGSILTVPRKNLKLFPNAYPSIFPNIPLYLTSEPSRNARHPNRDDWKCQHVMNSSFSSGYLMTRSCPLMLSVKSVGCYSFWWFCKYLYCRCQMCHSS